MRFTECFHLIPHRLFGFLLPILTACLIINIELILSWNSISGIYSITSTGQLIPFIMGVGGLVKVLNQVINKHISVSWPTWLRLIGRIASWSHVTKENLSIWPIHVPIAGAGAEKRSCIGHTECYTAFHQLGFASTIKPTVNEYQQFCSSWPGCWERCWDHRRPND